MKNKQEKPNKLAIEILNDLKDLEKTLHSDFVKIKVMQIEVKFKKLFTNKMPLLAIPTS